MNKNEKKTNNTEDDDLPDLEDFSHELNKLNEAKGINTSKSVPIKIEVKENNKLEKI